MKLMNKVGPVTAIALTVSAVVWMFAGGNGVTSAQANSTSTSESQINNLSSETKVLKQVQAQTLTSQNISTSLDLTGTTLANEELTLLAGYSGKILKINFSKGDFVTKGQVIAVTDTRALEADIQQAEVFLRQRKLELDGAQRLNTQKLASEFTLSSAKSELAKAQSTLKKLQVDLENAKLVAPFSGILNEVHVSETQLVQMGAPIAELVSVNPLIITGQVPQKHFNSVQVGTQATVSFLDDIEVTGNISFKESIADTGTRSIEIEVEIPNPDNRIPAGITAQINLSLPDQNAHGFTPALLTLDGNGHTAVKTLDVENHVTVTPIKIIKTDRDRVWVSGLPKSVNIITVGQGFTEAGEKVDVHYVN
jgi:multidrug efflux system membrane fusion protein